MKPKTERETGSIMVIAMLMLVILAVLASNVLRVAIPRFQVSYQTATWQEARLAAEAGIDLAIQRINANTPRPWDGTSNWAGWIRQDGAAASGGDLALGNASELSGVVATGAVGLRATPAIYLDNVPVTGADSMVDVQLNALYPNINDLSGTGEPNSVWFRIRAMGVSKVPGLKRAAADRMDAALHRVNLFSPFRVQVAANDIGNPSTVGFPNAARIVEVLAKPVFRFSKAIVTEDQMILPNSNNWPVDSYDSTDGDKSDDGIYPGENSPKIQINGDIASNDDVIDLNGADIFGDVSTKGGDVAATPEWENVIEGDELGNNADGNENNIRGKVDDDFDEELKPMTRPNPANPIPDPGDDTGERVFTATPGTTTYYTITSSDDDLGSFTVEGSGNVVILLDREWNLGTGNGAYVNIPTDATVTVYTRENVSFGNGQVNVTTSSNGTVVQYGEGASNGGKGSNIPANLVIIGEPQADGSTPTRSLTANGNANIAAVFYGPSFDVEVKGTDTWYGAVVSKTWAINLQNGGQGGGGGNGGFHYDESLGYGGSISRFEIASFLEDNRQ